MPHYKLTNHTTGEVIETAALGNDFRTFTGSQLVAADLAAYLDGREIPDTLRAEFHRRGFQGYQPQTK